MTSYQPYLNTAFPSGLRTDIRPFLIEEAFPSLTNAYVWRKRIPKKGGNLLLDRLGRRLDNLVNRTAGADTYNFITVFHPIEPGSIVITDGVTTFTDDGIGGFVITPNPANGTPLINQIIERGISETNEILDIESPKTVISFNGL